MRAETRPAPTRYPVEPGGCGVGRRRGAGDRQLGTAPRERSSGPISFTRTSCCLFSANQLRVFLTAAAYVLMQELRLRAARTACARSQVTWLRDRLLKLGVHVVRSVRRVVLHLPRSTPHLEAWRHIALALGARAG